MSPPEKEKPTGKGGLLRTDYDEESVIDSYVSRQDAMNRAYVRACVAAGIQPDVSGRVSPQEFSTLPAQEARGFEAGEPVPMTPPPVEKMPLTAEQILLRIISEACRWADGNPSKWQAFLSVAGYDLRSTSEIAAGLKISQRSFQLHVKSCRAWLEVLRAELEGK